MQLSKKAIQLSVNFLVMLILSIVIFGMGITFLYKIYSGAVKISDEMDTGIQEQLKNDLVANRLAIAPVVQTTSNRKTAMYSMGISNDLETPAPADAFTVQVSFATAIDANGAELTVTTDVNDWIKATSSSTDVNGLFKSISVPKNENRFFVIGLRPVDATKGTYTFNVEITTTDLYAKKQIHLKVK